MYALAHSTSYFNSQLNLHHCCLLPTMKTSSLPAILGFLCARCISSRRAPAFIRPITPTRRPTCTSQRRAAVYSDRRSLLVPTATCAGNTADLEKEVSSDSTCSPPITVERYGYDGWSLTYRYRPATPGHESDEPLILIHPVGIGCSAWIWTKMMEEWQGGAVYAPNLIGCGLEDGNDALDPDQRGLSVPLGWVKAVEALIQEKALAPPTRIGTGNDSDKGGMLGRFLIKASNGMPPASCAVVVQGGSAPIGVLLASRNPTVVSKLVLTSPPTFEDMTTATPEEQIAKNYNFYRSFWGKLAFAALESRWAVRLFSNLFLFLEECDERWVDLSTSREATTVEARPPVAIFNSGFLQHRSYEEELRELIEQPTLIISGSGDKRAEKRVEYGSEMKLCTLATLRGTNVLPWEAPAKVCEAIQTFSKTQSKNITL